MAEPTLIEHTPEHNVRQRANAELIVAAVNAAASPPPSVWMDIDTAPTHRHKKRGTEYVLIGIAKMQAEEWFDAVALAAKLMSDDPTSEESESVDMREVAVYRSATDPTEIWVRPREEFEDGRFEVLPPPPQQEGK